ncbi:glycosyltransferase family 2 protein [Antarcticibacterium flavum]|uniref:Glycosyltransferase family 2 protein n=1 Tax=Antarcticibacterium flavum TaxID=2058175 RepID=A0A5B7WZR2_9FLAO|nr:MULTISPECIES: glycosyltransferase family 2 protein [Antarcticibacterium]MCM4160762.1 dolichol-phosphate mannosyltransferase [Antarcticibacterium sp. W02-3]QCY68764.1 glycosyltransferase family 2 protein [Antarcticibacterium flavum]
MKYEFTIIIPVYNESESLKRLEEMLLEYLKKASKKTCVILVDDGSTDGSTEMIREISDRNQDIYRILFQENAGKGAALKAGFEATTSPLLGYMDADLQTHPEDFERLLVFANDYELVTGWRQVREDTGVKKISSLVGNKVRGLFINDGIHDTGCPLKVIHTQNAKQIPMFTGLQRFIPAMILLQKGRIKEVPVPHYPRSAGVSKYSFKNRFLGPLFDCFGYVWMKKTYINYHIKEKNTK